MLVIGITGPTGCGKTTLLQEIERRGGHIVDCDALYYALLASKEGAALRQELQTAFPGAFGADGSLRRKALGQLVFGDKARMAQLNEIVFFHVGNAVRARLVRERAAGRRLFAIDAINLFESGLAALCDTTVGVLAGRETRIARIMARDGLTREYAALRVDAQQPDSFYESHCGTILQNAGTREQFARTADQYLTNILKGAFPMTKQEREALLYQPKHGRDRLTKEDEAAMLTYCEDYKAFLDRSKTERECVVSAVELAEQAGFRALQDGMALQPGDKVYSVNRGKSILLAVIGKKPLSEGANIGAAHTDAPRLDFKPNPLYEDAELAYIKTHHYGGIRKYQWVTVPLELHGKIVRADGSEVYVKIGADPEDPQFVILQKNSLRIGQIEHHNVIIILVINNVLGNRRVQVARHRQHPEKALDQEKRREEARILPPVVTHALYRDLQVVAHTLEKLAQNITSVITASPAAKLCRPMLML